MGETGVRNFLYDFSKIIEIQGKTSDKVFNILQSDYQKFTKIISKLYEGKTINDASAQIELNIYNYVDKDVFIELFNIEFKDKNKDHRLQKIGYYMSKFD